VSLQGYGASKGSVLLLPTSGASKPSSSPATIAAHGAELGDLAWSPFVAGQLATGAADGTVKLWSVPSEGLSANLSTPTLKFDGLDSVHSLAFHPAASGILAAGGKTGLSVFDLEAGARKYAFETQGFGKDVTSVHWSRTGALLSAVGKNASLAVVDPRAAGADAIALATPSTLVKKLQHGLFIGGEGTGSPEHLLLFGVSAAQRPVMLWVDPRNPSAAIKTHDFDFSQGYSLPIYEPDTHTLFYTIRGSEMIALCDVESDKNAPSFWPSHTFGANGAVKGLSLLPKVAVDTNACEVNRVYTLGADAVDAYAVTVPRKTAGFHAELFPEVRLTLFDSLG
jgi:coronin-1B/1C/6